MKRTPEAPKSRSDRRRVANYLRTRVRHYGKPTRPDAAEQTPSRCNCGPVRHWECNAGCKYQFAQEK